MTIETILPTENPDWGMWGTSIRSGYDAEMCWQVASRFLAKTFKLKPEQAQGLLDHRFGRHLADDLSFIQGGPVNEEAIKAHLAARLAQPAWKNLVRITLKEIKAG
ncbi:MAG: hypothetical protein HQL43_06935 [Alphaproteobacteria bacterium]|nr:hypothetical protein [Alphaproteobacteria bacterium]